MKHLLLILALSASQLAGAQNAKQLVEAPDGTQGRPNTVVYHTTGTIVHSYESSSEIEEGFTCTQSKSDNSGLNWGTAAGAVVGGVVGSQFGSGRGSQAMAAAGAAGGALAGTEAVRSARARNSECFPVVRKVIVYVSKARVKSIEGNMFEMNNIRSYRKPAIGEEIPIKIQVNYFVSQM